MKMAEFGANCHLIRAQLEIAVLVLIERRVINPISLTKLAH